jgi:predicted nucleic acid-binding protein
MIGPVAALDSDVLMLLLDVRSDVDVARRRAFAELTIENLQKQRARFVVPTPVIAELCRRGPGSKDLRQVVKRFLGHARIEVLDEDSAELAGEIVRTRLQERAEGDERGVVKYDALIAAIAHKIGARWLVTGNARDFRRCLSVINSPVQVVVATEQAMQGQLTMVDMVKPPAQAAASTAPPRRQRK